jgi:hypothetical protein
MSPEGQTLPGCRSSGLGVSSAGRKQQTEFQSILKIQLAGSADELTVESEREDSWQECITIKPAVFTPLRKRPLLFFNHLPPVQTARMEKARTGSKMVLLRVWITGLQVPLHMVNRDLAFSKIKDC